MVFEVRDIPAGHPLASPPGLGLGQHVTERLSYAGQTTAHSMSTVSKVFLCFNICKHERAIPCLLQGFWALSKRLQRCLHLKHAVVAPFKSAISVSDQRQRSSSAEVLQDAPLVSPSTLRRTLSLLFVLFCYQTSKQQVYCVHSTWTSCLQPHPLPSGSLTPHFPSRCGGQGCICAKWALSEGLGTARRSDVWGPGLCSTKGRRRP